MCRNPTTPNWGTHLFRNYISPIRFVTSFVAAAAPWSRSALQRLYSAHKRPTRAASQQQQQQKATITFIRRCPNPTTAPPAAAAGNPANGNNGWNYYKIHTYSTTDCSLGAAYLQIHLNWAAQDVLWTFSEKCIGMAERLTWLRSFIC